MFCPGIQFWSLQLQLVVYRSNYVLYSIAFLVSATWTQKNIGDNWKKEWIKINKYSYNIGSYKRLTLLQYTLQYYSVYTRKAYCCRLSSPRFGHFEPNKSFFISWYCFSWFLPWHFASWHFAWNFASCLFIVDLLKLLPDYSSPDISSAP